MYLTQSNLIRGLSKREYLLMKVVDRAFQSFFALIEKVRRGEYRFQDIKLPKYVQLDSAIECHKH